MVKRLTKIQRLKIQSKFLENIMEEYPQIDKAWIIANTKDRFSVQLTVNLKLEQDTD